MESPGDPADPLVRKFELAEEFRQIGDKEGARDLLEEVVAKASGTLKARAQSLLDAYVLKWGDVAPAERDQEARAQLVKVTQVAPWTPAAWRAAKLLR